MFAHWCCGCRPCQRILALLLERWWGGTRFLSISYTFLFLVAQPAPFAPLYLVFGGEHLIFSVLAGQGQVRQTQTTPVEFDQSDVLEKFSWCQVFAFSEGCFWASIFGSELLFFFCCCGFLFFIGVLPMSLLYVSAFRSRTCFGKISWCQVFFFFLRVAFENKFSGANFYFSCPVVASCLLVAFCLCFCFMFRLFAPGHVLEKFSWCQVFVFFFLRVAFENKFSGANFYFSCLVVVLVF